MKATESKSTHSQQHTAKDKSSAEQAQELPFFSESTAEQPAFFQPGGISHIQPKLISGSRSFFQPSRVPTIQAKCAECEAEERQQEEGQGDIPEVQQMPAFESDEAPVQAKLTVGQPGDQYEQEADRVAATVVNRMNTPGLGNLSQPQSVETRFQGNSEFQQRVFRQAVDASVPNVQGDFEAALNSAKGGGSPLDNAFRAKVEPEMGADFSGVRVHTDAEADRLNRSIQANAFTTGQDIFFSQGNYELGSHQGQKLLAHELTHVVQQSQAGGKYSVTLSQASDSFEANANQHAVISEQSALVKTSGSPPIVQRDLTPTQARQEARRLYRSLTRGNIRGRSNERAIRALVRFMNERLFDPEDIGAIMDTLGMSHEELVRQIRDLEEMGSLSQGWAEGIQRRLQNAVFRRREAASQQAREEAPEQHRQRVLRHFAQEREQPNTPLSEFLLQGYDDLSENEQQAIQGILYFVHRQPREIRLPNSSIVLHPGHQYPESNRWFLGQPYRGGPLITMDNDLTGHLYAADWNTDIFTALAEAGYSARVWVPIAEVVAIMSAFYLGAAAAPELFSVTTGIRVSLQATGQATAALGRAAFATIRFAVSRYGLSPAAAHHIGRAVYLFYLRHFITVNFALIEGADISLNLAGVDTGPVSPSDILTFPVRVASRGGSQIVDVVVDTVNGSNIHGRINRIRSSSGDLAAEFGTNQPAIRHTRVAQPEVETPSTAEQPRRLPQTTSSGVGRGTTFPLSRSELNELFRRSLGRELRLSETDLEVITDSQRWTQLFAASRPSQVRQLGAQAVAREALTVDGFVDDAGRIFINGNRPESFLTRFHEAIHAYSTRSGSREPFIRQYSLFLEEAITEWLTRTHLGPEVASRHSYNPHIAFLRIMQRQDSRLINLLEEAYLDGNRGPFRNALRRFFNNNRDITRQFLDTLQEIGQQKENHRAFLDATEMLRTRNERPNRL